MYFVIAVQSQMQKYSKFESTNIFSGGNNDEDNNYEGNNDEGNNGDGNEQRKVKTRKKTS